jgi:thioredoxin reductase (NADPH)
MYDIAIIGSGPAGISAAVNATIRNKKIIIFGNEDLSNKLIKAPKIDNYIGFKGISGKELADNFRKHLNDMSINITTEKINAVYDMGETFTLMVNEKAYEAKSVILATGMEYGKPIKGEEKFLGKGVGYCATCDAPLYREKTVTVIGYNKDAEEEANYVSELAKKLYYVPMYRGEYTLKDDIEVVKERPVEVIGDDRVKSLKTGDKDIPTDGIFVLKDSVSPEHLVPGLIIENGHIKVDKNMGEGQIAALSAVSYLDNKFQRK